MIQDEAFDILRMGYNVFLTGAAGSGKTFLVNRFIRHCHEHGIGVAITASTGIAATHIGGMTIHSWSGMGIRETLTSEDLEYILAREYLMKRFAKTSVLIIDEISMLSGEFLASLDLLLQRSRVSIEPFGGIQVVLVGDFFQLPPVSKGSSFSEFAFEHSSWRTFSLAICALTTQYRQESGEGSIARHREVRSDPENGNMDCHVDFSQKQKNLLAMTENNTSPDPLLTILNEIRSGEVSLRSQDLLASRNIAVETDDHTELFTRNVSVDKYNTDRLNQIHDDTMIYETTSKGSEKLVESLKKGCLAPETLVLKKGARVMFVKNNFEAGYANGSIGHVRGVFEGMPVVELLDGENIIAEPMDWSIEENGKIKASITQVPLRLAWAITVHKSQGMTLDSAVMDLSDAFVAGQGYVALSRVRSLDGLILRGLNRRALEIDPRVIEYDRILRATSLRVSERLALLSLQERKRKVEEAIIRLGGVLDKKSGTSSGSRHGKKMPTHEETYILLQQGMDLESIATIRDVKASTIFSHIEKLIEEGKKIDLEEFRPDDEDRLARILDAFRRLSTDSLSPVKEYLEDEYDETYDYDELRMARLFL